MADTANGASTMDSLKASKVSYQLLCIAISPPSLPTSFTILPTLSRAPYCPDRKLTIISQCFRAPDYATIVMRP